MRYGSPWKASTGATTSPRKIPTGRAMAERTGKSMRAATSGFIRFAAGAEGPFGTAGGPSVGHRLTPHGPASLLLLDSVLEQQHPQGSEEREEGGEQDHLSRHGLRFRAEEFDGGSRRSHHGGSTER